MPATATDDDLDDFGYTDATNTDGNAGSRWQPVAAVLGDGEVLVAGGATFGFTDFVIRRSAMIYNPRHNTWRETAPLSEWRDGGRGLALSDCNHTDVYFIGRSHSGYFDDLTVEKFDGERWVSVSPPSGDATLSPFGGAALRVGRGLLFLTGSIDANRGDETPSGTNFFYTPPRR